MFPYDYALARAWARLVAHEERAGRPIDAADAWIAATAVHRSLTLFAHDRDFLARAAPGLTVVSFLDR